jgi:hypothetical protein
MAAAALTRARWLQVRRVAGAGPEHEVAERERLVTAPVVSSVIAFNTMSDRNTASRYSPS